MDKFRISFICNKEPDEKLRLSGFKAGEIYLGRMFNGLYEISPKWGSDDPTRILSKKTFNEYFEIVEPVTNP